MSVPVDRNVGTTACKENSAQTPPPTPEELIKQKSAGMAALLEALDLPSCTNVTAAGVSFFPPGAIGGQISIGCEQISVISGALDAVQKVLQCSLTSSSSNLELNATQSLKIKVDIGTYNAVNCTGVNIDQSSNVNIARYAAITTDIKQQMTASVNSAMEQFIESIKDQKTKGLFAAPIAQKTIDSMTQNLNQMILNDAVTSIVQSEMQRYENTAEIEFKATNWNVVNNTNNTGPTQPCFTISQDLMLQVLSQSILTSSLQQIFSGDAKASFVQMIKDAQTGKSEGFSFPNLGGSAIIIVIIIVALVLLFSKKPGGDGGEKQPVLAGKVGTIMGAILMVIGAILVVVGVVLKLKKTISSIFCYLMIAGGVILLVIGIVMLVRARSQQTEFEQNLKIAQARAGGATKK